MEENLIKRIQPHSTEAEQTVIGSMILDNECIPNMQNLISGGDFYNRQYGALFDAITELYSGNYTSPAKKGVEAEYYPDEDIWKVTIDNTHDDHGPGSGVVNVFRDNEFDHNEGLVDRPQ